MLCFENKSRQKLYSPAYSGLHLRIYRNIGKINFAFGGKFGVLSLGSNGSGVMGGNESDECFVLGV